jgi:hypothetical protein
VSNDDEVERQWREAVRKQREDSKPGPYGGDYGKGNGGCALIALTLISFLALTLLI